MKHLIPGCITVILAASLVGCTHQTTPQTSLESLSSPTEATPKSPSAVSASVATQGKFAIFTHGTFRVFTASMYHNLSPDAYIESTNPNIIKVKKAGLTWANFFATLPFKLATDCLTTGTGQTFCTEGRDTLKFYINGKLTPNALSQPISPNDELLISYGHEDDAIIQEQLNKLSSL